MASPREIVPTDSSSSLATDSSLPRYQNGRFHTYKQYGEDTLRATAGIVNQMSTASGRSRQKLLARYGGAFQLYNQHQHSETPQRDEACEVCDVPRVISKAQLGLILDMYEEQLHVYAQQRKAIEEVYQQGGVIKDLTPPPQLFHEVKGVRPVASGYFTKYEGHGGMFHTFFPEDMKDAFARMASADVQMLISGYESRMDIIANLLDNARTDQDDQTEAFHTLMSELSTVHDNILYGNEDPDGPTAAVGSLIDVNVEQIERIFAAAKVSGVPALAWQRAVPKDFSLYMSNTHEEHRDQVARLRRRLDDPRALGRPVSVSKRKRYQPGFDPTQLSRKHALNSGPNVPERASTLTNPVHPLFARKNFVDCPAEVYDTLKPALRLASMILLHCATSAYWHTAAFGKREVCSLNALRGEHSIRIRKDVPWSEDNARRFESHLTNIANHVRFYFNGVSPDTKIYGMCWLPCEHKRFILPLDAVWVHYAKIHIAFDFYTTAVRLSKTKNPDSDMVLRFNFLLANTILHEIAHFLEYAYNDSFTDEPYMNDNGYSEAGFAFEQKTFGGHIASINDRADCAYGLCIADYAPRDELHNEPHTVYSIRMEYIVKLQQQETWDGITTPDDRTFFHIPKTGARSCGTSTLSMQVWDDEANEKVVDIDTIGGRDVPAFRREMNGRILKSSFSVPSPNGEVAEPIKYDFSADHEKYKATAERQARDAAIARVKHVAKERVGKDTERARVERLKETNRRHRKAAKKRAKEKKAMLKRATETHANVLLSRIDGSISKPSLSTNRFPALENLGGK